MEDLKGKALRGGFAKFWAQAVTFVLRTGSLMILARLLDPKDFGLIAMVTSITGILNMFGDLGLSTATIQRPTITDRLLSTMFWTIVGFNGALSLMTIIIAPILVSFYHEPRLLWITIAMSSTFLISGACVQHEALLVRQMRFTALAVIDTICCFLSVAIGIGMAEMGFGYWALVGMTVSPAIIKTICCWLAIAWIPGPPRRGSELRGMLKFGGTVTVNNLVVYIAYNTEKVLLGRFWGTETLGIYGRAYQLVNLPTRNLNQAIGGVAISALSRLQDDPVRLKNFFLKGYSLVLAMTLPVTIACALFADDLILVVLGPKWGSAATILRLLAPTILAFALIDPMGWLLWATGRVVRSLKIALLIAPLVIGAYLVGLPHGPNGVAIGYSAMMMLLIIPVISWSKNGTPMTSADVWRALRSPLVSAIVAVACSLGVRVFITPEFTPPARLALLGSVMTCSFLVMLLYVMRQKVFYLDLIREVLKRPLLVGNPPES